MYLHSLQFIAWVSITCMGHHHSHVPTFTTWMTLCTNDIFPTPMYLHSLCSLYHCMGSIHCVGSHQYCIPTLTVFTASTAYCIGLHTVWGSILLCDLFCTKGGDLFALGTLSLPPYTYIYCILHESNLLHGVPTTNIH